MSNSLVTPRTVAHQAPLSMGFPRQEYWSGLPSSSPWDLPNSGIEPASPALAGGATREAPNAQKRCHILNPGTDELSYITTTKRLSKCD